MPYEIDTDIYVHIHLPSFQNKIQNIPITSDSPLCPFLSHTLPVSTASCKWNHPVCISFWCVSFNMFVRLTQLLLVSVSFFFFFGLSTIPFYESAIQMYWTTLLMMGIQDISRVLRFYNIYNEKWCYIHPCTSHFVDVCFHSSYLGVEMLGCEADVFWIL